MNRRAIDVLTYIVVPVVVTTLFVGSMWYFLYFKDRNDLWHTDYNGALACQHLDTALKAKDTRTRTLEIRVASDYAFDSSTPEIRASLHPVVSGVALLANTDELTKACNDNGYEIG